MLNESKQVGVLYHFTKPESLYKMLDDDLQKRHGVSGALHLISHNGKISTSRNHNLPQDALHNFSGKSDITHDNGYSVRIALDGDKISEHHKVRPVLGLKDKGSDTLDIKNTNRVSRRNGESEEEIQSKELPMRQYIKRIDFVNHTNLSDEDHAALSKKIDEHGIPNSRAKMWHKNYPELKESVFQTIKDIISSEAQFYEIFLNGK